MGEIIRDQVKERHSTIRHGLANLRLHPVFYITPRETMKELIAIFSILLTVILGLVDMNTRQDISIGYFLVAAAGLIGAALWRRQKPSEKSYVIVANIYRKLASEPMEVKALVDSLTGNGDASYENRDRYTSTVGRMLSEGDLIIVNGKVSIPSDTSLRSND